MFPASPQPRSASGLGSGFGTRSRPSDPIVLAYHIEPWHPSFEVQSFEYLALLQTLPPTFMELLAVALTLGDNNRNPGGCGHNSGPAFPGSQWLGHKIRQHRDKLLLHARCGNSRVARRGTKVLQHNWPLLSMGGGQIPLFIH